MIRAKFQDHRTSGSGEDFLRILPYMGMGAWSCDLDHLYKLSFPFTRRLYIKFGLAFSKKTFENNGYVHVYSPGAGANNPWGQFILINSIIQAI